MPRSTYGWSAEHDAWTAFGHDNRGNLATQFGRNLGSRLLPIAAKLGKPLSDWTAADVFRAMPEADSSLPLQPNFAIPNVAGSLLCTAPEYARFLALVTERPTRATWELTEPRRREMLTPQVEVKAGTLSWGLGWGLERTERDSLYWHWGDNGAFKAFTIADPVARRGIVVFTNGSGGQKVYERIIRAAIGRDLPAFLWV